MTSTVHAFLAGVSLLLSAAAVDERDQQRPPAAPPAADAEPALSLDTLDKLRDRARGSSAQAITIGADISELAGLDARSRPARQLSKTRGGVAYRLAFCLPWEDDYLLFFVERPDGLYVYRADSALSLRNAGRINGSSMVRLDRDQALAGFQRVLRAWEEF